MREVVARHHSWANAAGTSLPDRPMGKNARAKISDRGKRERPMGEKHGRIPVCRTPAPGALRRRSESDSVGYLTLELKSETHRDSLHGHPQGCMELQRDMHAYAWGYDTPGVTTRSGVSVRGCVTNMPNAFQNSLFSERLTLSKPKSWSVRPYTCERVFFTL